MHIQTFMNHKGLIHGRNTKRIRCEKGGVLTIGATDIEVPRGSETILPILFHGATGSYTATFVTEDGEAYDLGKVEVRNGRLVPPSAVQVELMDLRARTDLLEIENKALREKVAELEKIFDTDALNFLIKQEETK